MTAGTLRSVDVNCRRRVWEPALARGALTDMVKHVGACDSFATGFLVEVAHGLPREEAFGTAVSAAAVGGTCPGDSVGLPTRAEVDLVGGADVVR